MTTQEEGLIGAPLSSGRLWVAMASPPRHPHLSALPANWALPRLCGKLFVYSLYILAVLCLVVSFHLHHHIHTHAPAL